MNARTPRFAPRSSSVVRSFALLSLSCLALSWLTSVASAGLPPGPNISYPASIRIVGHSGGVPDPFGRFEVVVRDLVNLPVPNADVRLDFSQALDVRLSATVSAPGVITNCAQRTVSAITDADGKAVFTIAGASTSAPAQCLTSGSTCFGTATVYADGVLAGTTRVAVLDLDGASGMGGADLAAWLDDFSTGLNPTRSDLDGNDTVGGADLSIWLSVFGAGGSMDSASPFCP